MPPIWFVFSMPIELGLNRIPVVKVIRDHSFKTSALFTGRGLPIAHVGRLEGGRGLRNAEVSNF